MTSPVFNTDGLLLDQIRLTGITATGFHGVLPQERTNGQTFVADVVLHLDVQPAAAGDDLAATVNYADVASQVHDVLGGEPVDLIETVAERIATVALAHPSVQAVDVCIHKPQAPIPVPFTDVEVAIRRVKAPTAAVLPPVVAPVNATPPVGFGGFDQHIHPEVSPPPPVPIFGTGSVDLAPVPEAGVDPLDAVPAGPVPAVLALGGNLGDAKALLQAAVHDLSRMPGIRVMQISPLARTVAVGGPADQPDYLNAVIAVETVLSPRDLLRAAQAIEQAHGRTHVEHWGPRTLDIDLICYDSLVASAPDLTLPHPRAAERAFVLVPWAQMDPTAELPGLGGGPIAALAATAPDADGIRWLALDWCEAPPGIQL